MTVGIVAVADADDWDRVLQPAPSFVCDAHKGQDRAEGVTPAVTARA